MFVKGLLVWPPYWLNLLIKVTDFFKKVFQISLFFLWCHFSEGIFAGFFLPAVERKVDKNIEDVYLPTSWNHSFTACLYLNFYPLIWVSIFSLYIICKPWKFSNAMSITYSAGWNFVLVLLANIYKMNNYLNNSK